MGPLPERADDPDAASWGDGWRMTGAANVWAPIAVDEARGLIFLPTTSPSPDFYGGLRPGDNRRADSVVALKAETGALVWSSQLVHHDLWDYDIPAQPSLATITLDGKERDVVIQGTKQGLIFVLDRDTGQPVLPVEERPVPQGGVDGEALSPTQPFPADLPALGPDRVTPDEAWGLTPWDRGACAKAIASARSEGRFTPPSLKGTLVMPFTGGGVNWGGLAVDGAKGVVYVNTSNLVHRITLFPAADYAEMKQRFPDNEVSPQRGAPYGMKRELLASPLGLPCNPPPWGVLTALDLGNRKILWQSAGYDRGTQPAGPRPPRWHADLRRPARHGKRPHLHWRCARQLSARVRREDRRRALDRPPALRRHRHPDKLSLAGPPICRDRRRRPWRSRRPGRRHAGRLRPATPWQVRPLALAALARSAGRPFQLHAAMAGTVALALVALLWWWRGRRHRRPD